MGVFLIAGGRNYCCSNLEGHDCSATSPNAKVIKWQCHDSWWHLPTKGTITKPSRIKQQCLLISACFCVVISCQLPAPPPLQTCTAWCCRHRHSSAAGPRTPRSCAPRPCGTLQCNRIKSMHQHSPHRPMYGVFVNETYTDVQYTAVCWGWGLHLNVNSEQTYQDVH